MIKKGRKILIAALLGILIPLVATASVSAKEMNMTEITEAIVEYNPDVTELYIVGDYAFTSEREFTLEDMMLGARSISVVDTAGRTDKDDVYGEMSIIHFTGTYDNDYNLTGFKYVKHIAGDTPVATTYDIKYIDYNKQYTIIDVNSLVDEAFNTIKGQAATDKFVVNKTSDTTMDVILMDTEMASLDALAGTGIATAAANFLKDNGIATVTLTLGNAKVVIDENLDQEAIEAFFKELGNKAGDLIGKTITATVAFEDGYKSANSTSFAITFKDSTKVDVDSLVNTAFNTIKNQAATDKFEVAKDGNKIAVTIKDTEMASLDALAGTGIATAAANFLQEEGIASVTLALGNTKVTIDENLDQEAIEAFFKELGNKAGDLAGKTITATVAFKDGYKTSNTTTFGIVFGTMVDVNALVDEAYDTIKGQAATDKFVVNKISATEMKVVLMDTEMASLDALAGTGIATAAANFLKDNGIATVTLTLGEAKVVIDENLDQEAIEAFFKELGTKAGDLAGKTITATLAFKDGFTTANSEKFVITFKEATKVDVNALVEEAFNTIKNQAATDKFEIAKDGNDINVTIKDTEMASLDALAGTGIATAAANFLKDNGIASVTLALGNAKVTIDESLDQEAIEAFFKELGTKAGDLAGKTITATVAFEDGYKTANATSFAVNFGTKVDVNTLVDKAYNTIKNQAATDKFVVSKTSDTAIEVILMDTEMASLDALAGTGIASAAANFLKDTGVKTVTLAIGTTTVRIDENLDQEAIENFFKALGTKAGDLIGKTMIATLSFEDGYTTANSEKFTITFKDSTKVDVNALVDEAFDTIKGQAATDKFEIAKDGNDINVTIKDTEMASLDALAGTGIATAAANFLKDNGIATVTLTLGEAKVVIDENLDQDAIEAFFKELGTKAGDLAGKTITATMAFEAGYETANATSFAVNFGTKVDVNALVDAAFNTIKGQAATDKFVATKTSDTTMDVILMDTEMASLDALAGTGIATAAANFLKDNGIATVTLTLGEAKVVIDENLDQEAIEAFFKELGNKAEDLIGKTITATLAFKEGYTTANAEKFDVTFKDSTKVDVNALVDEAFETIKGQAATDKFEIAKDGSNINVTIKDTDMASLDALAGTGIATAAANFLKDNGIATVTLTLGEAKVVIDENLDQEAIEAFFKELGTKAGDLAGKTITATLAFEDGYKTANATSFAVNFGTKVDVNELVEEAFTTIKNQAATDKFTVNLLDATTIEVVLKDTEMASLDALAGTGIATAAANFLKDNGIESVTLLLGEAKVVIDENLDQEAIENFFKELGTKAGDLVGRPMTAELTFKDGFQTNNSDEFTIQFSEAVTVNF